MDSISITNIDGVTRIRDAGQILSLWHITQFCFSLTPSRCEPKYDTIQFHEALCRAYASEDSPPDWNLCRAECHRGSVCLKSNENKTRMLWTRFSVTPYLPRNRLEPQASSPSSSERQGIYYLFRLWRWKQSADFPSRWISLRQWTDALAQQ